MGSLSLWIAATTLQIREWGPESSSYFSKASQLWNPAARIQTWIQSAFLVVFSPPFHQAADHVGGKPTSCHQTPEVTLSPKEAKG